MSVTLIRHRDYSVSPWRNGGGVTREVGRWPAAEESDVFRWRISMATVAEDGPFSAFPGVDRVLGIVAGDGVVLTVDGDRTEVVSTGDPVEFDGAATTSSQLIGGEVTDLNVMVQHGVFGATMRRVTVRPARTVVLPAVAGRTIFVVPAGSGLDVAAGTAVAAPDALDTVRVDVPDRAEERICLTSTSPQEVSAMVVTLIPLRGAGDLT